MQLQWMKYGLIVKQQDDCVFSQSQSKDSQSHRLPCSMILCRQSSDK